MARVYNTNRPNAMYPPFGTDPRPEPMYVLAVGYDNKGRANSSRSRPGSAHHVHLGASSGSQRAKQRPSSAARTRSRHSTHLEQAANIASFGYGTVRPTTNSQRPASANRTRPAPTRSNSSGTFEKPRVPIPGVPRSSSAAVLTAAERNADPPQLSARSRTRNRPTSASATRNRTAFHVVQLGDTLGATPTSRPQSAAHPLLRQNPKPPPVVQIPTRGRQDLQRTGSGGFNIGDHRRGSNNQIEVISLPRPKGIAQQLDENLSSESPNISPSPTNLGYSNRIPSARPMSAHAGYSNKSANSAAPVEILVDGTVGRQENSQDDPFGRRGQRVRPSTAGYRRPGELQYEPTLLETDSFDERGVQMESPAALQRTDSSEAHKPDFSSRSMSTVLNEIPSPSTEMRQASMDTVLADSAHAPILNLSTVPNQYCSAREAMELRPLIGRTSDAEDKGSIDLYVVGKMLGIGSYGKVRMAWHRLTAQKVAVKSYDKSKLRDPAQFKRVQSEIKIMEKLSHPRVVRMFETIETAKRLHLVLECVEGGNLCSYVKAKRKLGEDEARRILFQILQALDYIHSQHIAHRDVKLENVLFDEEQNVKLIDFGFSVACKEKRLKVFCGTPSYMAPEIVRRMDYEGPPVDMWSVGVVLYALLCGYFPFRGRSYPDLYRKICHGIFTIPENLSPQARDLIRSLLQLDPRRRATASAALKHPWLASCVMPDNKKLRADCAYLISEHPSDDLQDNVLSELASYGVSVDVATECVTQRKHNGVATLYYLLLASHAQKHTKDATEQKGLNSGATQTKSYPTPAPGHLNRTTASPDPTSPASDFPAPRRYHRPRSAGIR